MANTFPYCAPRQWNVLPSESVTFSPPMSENCIKLKDLPLQTILQLISVISKYCQNDFNLYMYSEWLVAQYQS